MRANVLAVAVSLAIGGVIGAVIMNCWSSTDSREETAQVYRLNVGDINRGEITQSSLVNLKDGSRYQPFEFTPDKEGVLRIEQSGALDGQLILLNREHEVIQASYASSFDVWIGEALINEPLTLVVSGTHALAYGPFRIEATWLAMGSEEAFLAGEEVSRFLGGAPGQYSVVIEEPGMYQFDMKSSDFDSFLRLEGQYQSYSDDDSGEGLDARLVAFLEAGEYRLFTTTPYGDAEGIYGMYQLRMQQLEQSLDLHQGDEVSVGDNIHSFMTGSSREFTLTLLSSAELSISAESDVFDTVLEVAGPEYFYDDDGGVGTNSLINEYFPAGVYTIQVRPYRSGNGLFRLSVSER